MVISYREQSNHVQIKSPVFSLFISDTNTSIALWFMNTLDRKNVAVLGGQFCLTWSRINAKAEPTAAEQTRTSRNSFQSHHPLSGVQVWFFYS